MAKKRKIWKKAKEVLKHEWNHMFSDRKLKFIIAYLMSEETKEKEKAYPIVLWIKVDKDQQNQKPKT